MQKDERGERTPQEAAAFGTALETMGVWYAHRLTTTFIMSQLPDGWPKTEEARPFFPDECLRGKGWPSFERAVSGLVKRASVNSWRRIVDPAVARDYSAGQSFDVQPKSSFDIEIKEGICEYICTFID